MKNLLFLVLLLLFACKANDAGSSSDWLIPVDEILDGGPGKDGIPSVDEPQFDLVGTTTTLSDEDLVIGLVNNGMAKAYPHNILDWHEIVNDDLSNMNYALTYCPLTGTGIAWDREIEGKLTTFGVSGKLYNTNLMPYDRETDSYWSQLRLDCVHGDHISKSISTFPIIETSWATWKKAYPNSEVMTTETGFSRNYNNYPYGDYRTNHNNIIFPVSQLDERLPAKERVLGIISTPTTKVYPITLFENGRAIEDNIDGLDLVLVGSESDNYIVAFERETLSGWSFLSDQLPAVAKDQNGNILSLDGSIIEGPMMGTQLKPLNSFMGYFFAFGAFYDVELYEE